MLNFKFHRLKIIEQIAIVFFFAVVIPMSISGFVINNVNQQAVRHQLRESAILVASMVSDEMDYLIQSSEATTLQIADALEYLPTTYQKNKFLKEMEKKYPYCQKLSIVKNQKEMEKLTDSSKIDEQPIISTQLKDGSFLVFLFNSKNIDIRLFKSFEDDNTPIYIILTNNNLID